MFLEAMLTVNEVAQLSGKSPRHIRRMAQTKKLSYKVLTGPNGCPQYVFPLSALSALDPALAKKYLDQRQPQGVKAAKQKNSVPSAQQPEPLENFTAAEREEISFWAQTVREWQDFRASMPSGDAKSVDDAFVALLQARHPGLAVSRGILYARQRAVSANDYRRLTDGRGKARGYNKIPPDAWEAFLYYYLDEAQHPIRRCYEYTTWWAEQYAPELLPLPEYTTFYRHAKADLPMAVTEIGRAHV